ncbi:hypothetical protein VTK56DRAFT_4769 [Thermocarpiscus australiensis]
MENGKHNGVRTNHDRNTWTNGVKEGGLAAKQEFSPDAQGIGCDSAAVAADGGPHGLQPSKIEELPDEVQHITTDILPLDLLLTRLAQYSHAVLEEQISALASKPTPQILPNGNSSYLAGGVEDTSPESLEKKTMLLNFIQELHTRWVKALVISEWSKKADQVGRLIDIRSHLASKIELFNFAFWDLIKTKQDLLWAKVPSPDLKTALEVLSNGEVFWMPDFNYLDLPPVSLEEKESWIENINTLLHARLKLDDYESIPEPFRDYTIDSGRVTFRVKGEFEVDLTIGDDDFEQQFWFIDFRFLFRPAPSELSERARWFMEAKVNEALATNGLLGCYKYLHEFTLTAKIGEFTRQAAELSKVRWVDTLKIERLNRGLAIQYWLNRPHSQGTKSWIILGVNSGKGPDGVQDPSSPSYLSLRWFRDNKEVKDFDIPLDAETISTERLMTTVVARHVEHLLSSIHSKLLSKPRFAQRHARLELKISTDEPVDSSLTMQLISDENVTVRIDPLTGAFALLPRSTIILGGEGKFNSMQNPAEEGPIVLEQLRCFYTFRDLSARARSVGWSVHRPLLPMDELKTIVSSAAPSTRETFQSVWMRMAGWHPQWFVMLSMSLAGDHWWLIELSGQKQGFAGSRVKIYTRMPMSAGPVRLSETFLQSLAVYAAGMISQITDLRELHTRRTPHASRDSVRYGLPSNIKMPTIYVRLADMVPDRQGFRASASIPWAREYIPIIFRGLQSSSEDLEAAGNVSLPQRRELPTRIIAEAKLAITNRRKFQFLKGNLDRDILYNPRIGEFSLRLRAEMGIPVVSLLSARIQALERLIAIAEAVGQAGKDVRLESITLREVVFTYGSSAPESMPSDPLRQRRWRVRLDLSKEQEIDLVLEQGNPHLRALDYLRSVANSPKSADLPLWLVLTLPLYRALDRLEDSWENVMASNAGSCYVFNKALDWITIRFALPAARDTRRVVNLDIKPRDRKGKLSWHVSRSDADANARNENDEFNRVLRQRVWSASGGGFKGLTTGASASLDEGIENLLALIGESILSMVATSPQSG